MASVLVLQHSDLCVPGRLGEALTRHGLPMHIATPYRDGPAAIPSSLSEWDGIITLGGPQSANDPLDWIQAELELLARAHRRGVPLVGVCLGHQLIAKALGGSVEPMAGGKPEAGFHTITLNHAGQSDPVLSGLPWQHRQFCAHGEQVVKAPDGATILASSKACANQVMRLGMRTYSFQYHFEWTDTMAWKIAEDDLEFFARAGLRQQDLDAQMGEHYARFDQISWQLCNRLVELVLQGPCV